MNEYNLVTKQLFFLFFFLQHREVQLLLGAIDPKVPAANKVQLLPNLLTDMQHVSVSTVDPSSHTLSFSHHL